MGRVEITGEGTYRSIEFRFDDGMILSARDGRPLEIEFVCSYQGNPSYIRYIDEGSLSYDEVNSPTPELAWRIRQEYFPETMRT